jgi:hypothetical protein
MGLYQDHAISADGQSLFLTNNPLLWLFMGVMKENMSCVSGFPCVSGMKEGGERK